MLARAELAQSGIDHPQREAALLMTLASGMDRAEQIGAERHDLPEATWTAFWGLVERRAAREPYAFLKGSREFFGREFSVGPGTLIPRPETELLVEIALSRNPDRSAPLRILDLGTGSGCLLVTLLLEFPNASGVGIDRSAAALAWTRRNIARHGVAARAGIAQGAWAAALGNQATFDLVVGNPPYVSWAELERLEPELRFEPATALAAGPSGLEAYHDLTADLQRLLATTGDALLEIGRGQADDLRAWFEQHGFVVDGHRDLSGIIRTLHLHRPAK